MADAKKNVREVADEDLRKELDGLIKALFNLRVRKVTDVVESPATFRQNRRRIAQIKATLQQRSEGKSAPAAPAAPAAPVKVAEKSAAPAPAPAKPAKKAAPKAKAKKKAAAK